MKHQEIVTESIGKAAAEVFSTMLGVELPPGEAGIENGTPPVSDGVVSLVGLAGSWVGIGCLSCSPAMACRFCSLMLMTEVTAVNEDVLDAVAELTNMIIGGVKNDLEHHLGQLGLSIPTVVFGRNFRTKNAGTTEWVVVRYSWEGESLSVKLALTPAERAAQTLSQTAGHPCTLDM